MKLSPPKPFPEFASVLSNEAFPAAGVPRDARGAVVHVYNGGEAYEVEFFDDDLQTIDVVTVKHHQVRPRPAEPAEARQSA